MRKTEFLEKSLADSGVVSTIRSVPTRDQESTTKT